MKKVFKITLIIIAIFMFTFMLSSCSDDNKGNDNKELNNTTIKEMVVDADKDYYQFDDLDVSKIVARVTYSNGEVKDLQNSDLTINTKNVDMEKSGNSEFVVSYMDKEIPIQIYINKLENIELEVVGHLYKGEEIDKKAIKCYGIYSNNKKRELNINKVQINCDVNSSGEKDIDVLYNGFTAKSKIKVIKRLEKELNVKVKEGTVFNINRIISEYEFIIKATIDNVEQVVNSNISISEVDVSSPGVKPITFNYYYLENDIPQTASKTINIEICDKSILCKTYNNKPVVNFEKGEDIILKRGKNNLAGFTFMDFVTNDTKDIMDEIVYEIPEGINNEIGLHEIEIKYTHFDMEYSMDMYVNIFEILDFNIYYLKDNVKTPLNSLDIYQNDTFYYNYELIVDFNIKYNYGEGEKTAILTYDVNGDLDDYVLGLFDKLKFNPTLINTNEINNNLVTVTYKKPNGNISKSFIVNVIKK